MLIPEIAAMIALITVTGRNGSAQVATPTERGLCVIRQYIHTPQIIFKSVPKVIPREKQKRNLLRCSVPSPMI